MGKFKTYGSLTLAYVGDAVYEAYIRLKLTEKGDKRVNALNKEARRYVSARAQCAIVEKIMGELTGEERAVYLRGRNAKVYTKAKNADLREYHSATGFEAVIGYLYLTGEKERLGFLLGKATGLAE
jgi:ribonuclease-3 family protein